MLRTKQSLRKQMNRIRKYLSQPYPLEENVWKIIIPISLFIGLFMVIFQPFGLNNLQVDYKIFVLAGYGLVTFIIQVIDLLILPQLLPGLYRSDRWTVLKEIVNLTWILFTVGLGNMVYSSFTMGFELNLNNIIIFQAYTLAIGIIPITALTLIKQGYLKRKNETAARAINETLVSHAPTGHHDQSVQFIGEGQNEELIVDACDILFIKSDGNYITAGYLKNNRFTQVLLRNKMKYAAEQLAPFPFLYQCHRSWIVNLEQITRVSGNSQGLRVVVENFEDEIPVARKNAPEFRERIAAMRQ